MARICPAASSDLPRRRRRVGRQHLRGEVADQQATGLDAEETFLVAIKGLGNLDAVSREFAREHSDRL